MPTRAEFFSPSISKCEHETGFAFSRLTLGSDDSTSLLKSEGVQHDASIASNLSRAHLTDYAGHMHRTGGGA